MYLDTEKLKDHFKKKLQELERQKAEIEKKLDLVGELENLAKTVQIQFQTQNGKLAVAIMEVFQKRQHAMSVSDVVSELKPYGYSEDHYPEIEKNLNRLYHRGRLDKSHDESGQVLFKRVPKPPPAI